MTRESSGLVGVICGTGLLEHFELSGRQEVETEYGRVVAFTPAGSGCCIIPRHGLESPVPPHRVNYRANVSCLHRLGVRSVIATSAVGSMNPRIGIGRLGTVGQFIDFTKGRAATFYDEGSTHADMTNPYSVRLNRAIAAAARRLRTRVASGLVYVCTEGPRFETAAEIMMFRRMGGDVVGMTGVPEVVLANELGMEYSTIAVTTNWAAGIQERITHAEVLEEMSRTGPKVKSLIVAATELMGREKGV